MFDVNEWRGVCNAGDVGGGRRKGADPRFLAHLLMWGWPLKMLHFEFQIISAIRSDHLGTVNCKPEVHRPSTWQFR